MERALALTAALLSLLGATGWPAGAGAQAQHAAPVGAPAALGEPEVVWGAGGAGAAGRLTPVRVRLESRHSAFSGTVVLTLSQRSFVDDRPSLLELDWPVQLPVGGEAAVWLLAPGEPGSSTLRVEASGLSPAAFTAARAGRLSSGSIALVLSASAEGWEFLGQWRPRRHEGAPDPDPLRVVYLTEPASVPPWFLGYQSAGLVAIAPDFPLDRLRAAQLDALAAYARDGGRLVVPESPPAGWRETPLWTLLLRRPAAVPRVGAIPMRAGAPPDPARFASVAPALGLEPAPPGPGRSPAPAALPSADALREQVLAALSAAPVNFPPRWTGLAAGAYVLAGWAWVRSFPRWKPRSWIKAGLALVGAASAGAFLLGVFFFGQADRPQAVLLVRQAALRDPQAEEPAAYAGDPVQAELLLSLPGLLSTAWEIRPSAGEGELLPAPLWPSELAPGTAGVRLKPQSGPDGRTGWLVEPLRPPLPSTPAQAAGGWRAAFYLDAPLVDVAQKLAPGGRIAIVSAAGAAAISRSDLTFQGRTALLGREAAQVVAFAEQPALELGADVLEGKLTEALASPRPSPDARLVRVAAAAAARSAAGAAASGTRYAVLVGTASAPVAEARRPGRPWQPVRPHVVIITAALPAGAGAATGESAP